MALGGGGSRGRRSGGPAGGWKDWVVLATMVLALAVAMVGVGRSWGSVWRELWFGSQGQAAAGEVVEDGVAAGQPQVEGSRPDVSEEDVLPETEDAGVLPVRAVSYTSWDADASPNYWRMVGAAVVDVDIPAGQVWYAPLDELGRTTRAAGTVNFALMEDGLARERGSLQGHDPSGWGYNERASIVLPGDRSYNGYFWNRSHLVAKSLGGSDEVDNLVCGTRTQNVGANDGKGGMSYVEGLVRDWLFDHPEGTVFYSATPAYEGDELVCRSVVVDVRSDDGQLDLEVEVYNAALGYRIDYATGEFWAEG